MTDCCDQHDAVTSVNSLLLKPLSHSTTIPRCWHGDLKFLRAPWHRTKILENKAKYLTFSTTWRYHGAPKATLVFLRSVLGVPQRFHEVLAGDSLRGHRAPKVGPWCAKSCHYASTACTRHARRVQCVARASARIVYEHISKSAPGVLQKSRSCLYTWVASCLICCWCWWLVTFYWRHFFVIFILIYFFHVSEIGYIMVVMSAISEI